MIDIDYYTYAVKMYKTTKDEVKRAYYKGVIEAFRRAHHVNTTVSDDEYKAKYKYIGRLNHDYRA